MSKHSNTVWFSDFIQINCNLDNVANALKNLGQHFKEVVQLMPGMTKVEHIEQGNDFVTLKTNEGIMERTHVSINQAHDQITLAFHEKYQAGKSLTVNSHFLQEFKISGNVMQLRVQISNLKAPGVLGFFYKRFGSKNIGKTFLNAYKLYYERRS